MIKFTAECPHCHQTTMVCMHVPFVQSDGEINISIEDIAFALDDDLICQHCETSFSVDVEVNEDSLF